MSSKVYLIVKCLGMGFAECPYVYHSTEWGFWDKPDAERKAAELNSEVDPKIRDCEQYLVKEITLL